jgi:hypothetical protein
VSPRSSPIRRCRSALPRASGGVSFGAWPGEPYPTPSPRERGVSRSRFLSNAFWFPSPRAGVSPRSRWTSPAIVTPSPRGRGCLQARCPAQLHQGPFPAWAGVSPWASWTAPGRCSLPRVSGGVSQLMPIMTGVDCPSPREWWCLRRQRHARDVDQPFPARVGVSPTSRSRRSSMGALPRASGVVSATQGRPRRGASGRRSRAGRVRMPKRRGRRSSRRWDREEHKVGHSAGRSPRRVV